MTASQAMPPAEAPADPADTQTHDPARQSPSDLEGARRYPRYPYRSRVEATILPLPGAPDAAQQAAPVRCTMLSRDLSRGGMNLLYGGQVEPGQQIEVMLEGAPRLLEVMWCRRLTNRCFSIGGKFVGRRSGPERSQGDPRFPYRAEVEATIHPPPEAAQQPAVRCTLTTRDLSRGGINLEHRGELRPGQRIEIFLNGIKRCVEAVVLWCRQVASNVYSAGCRFVGWKDPSGEGSAADEENVDSQAA